MTRSQATAEVFWTAFKALPRKDRLEVVRRVAADDEVRRDLLDLATIARRKREPSRPLRDVLKTLSPRP